MCKHCETATTAALIRQAYENGYKAGQAAKGYTPDFWYTEGFEAGYEAARSEAYSAMSGFLGLDDMGEELAPSEAD